MKKALVAALIGFAIAACASTQSTRPGQTPSAFEAAPFSAAGAKAAGEAAISKAGAQRFFRSGVRNLVSGPTPFVQHVASGLTCVWLPSDELNILVFPTQAPMTPGDDVGCRITAAGVGFITLSATRYPAPTTLEAQLRDATAAIEQRFNVSGPSPFARRSPLWERGVLPANLTAGYPVKLGDRDAYTAVGVAIVNGWVIKMSYTGPRATGPSLADNQWANALGWITLNKPAG